MTLKEIIQKYPIKNHLWAAHENSLTAWASECREAVLRDPWNRPFLADGHEERDGDNDVTCWNYTTTVNGWVVKLTVFND